MSETRPTIRDANELTERLRELRAPTRRVPGASLTSTACALASKRSSRRPRVPICGTIASRPRRSCARRAASSATSTPTTASPREHRRRRRAARSSRSRPTTPRPAARSPRSSAEADGDLAEAELRQHARRRARRRQRDRLDQLGRRRHGRLRLGGDADADVPALGRAPRLRDRGARRPGRRRGRAPQRHLHGVRASTPTAT